MRALELHGRAGRPGAVRRLLRAKIDRYKQVVLQEPTVPPRVAGFVRAVAGAGAGRDRVRRGARGDRPRARAARASRDLFDVLVTHRRRGARQARPGDVPALPRAAPRGASGARGRRTAWCSRTPASASPSAHAAGMRCVAVHTSGELVGLAAADLVVQGLTGELAVTGCSGRRAVTIDEVIAGRAGMGGSRRAGRVDRRRPHERQLPAHRRRRAVLRADPRPRLVAARGRPPRGAPEHPGGGRGRRRRPRVVHGRRRAGDGARVDHRRGAERGVAASRRRGRADRRQRPAPARRAAVRQRVRHVPHPAAIPRHLRRARLPDPRRLRRPRGRRAAHRAGDGRAGRRPRAVQQRPAGGQLHRHARRASGSSTTSTPA